MLIVDVEGEVSAASMVKDSKVYIEIAKFVQAYNTIIKNPNIFLSEIGEKIIDSENEVLTWEQFVKIASSCDFGFDPVPTENQLAMYYSYAIQIGSISKENKVMATVNDVAEAQKKYYNFIDDTTKKMEAQYNKQHQITENRASEANSALLNIQKKQLKIVGILCGMALGVFLCGIGLAGLFFEISFVKFFGFGNRYVGAVILIIAGFLLFFFLDRMYVKIKRDYLQYKKDSDKIISKSDRTTRDELMMRDKLDKFKEDLKIAKYELEDKDKSFDVKNCIEKLKLKNKYYQNLLDNEETRSRPGLFDSLFRNNIDDLPMKEGRKSLSERIAERLFGDKLSPEEMENLSKIRSDKFIDDGKFGLFDRGLFDGDLKHLRGGKFGRRGDREEFNIHGNDVFYSDYLEQQIKEEKARMENEMKQQQVQATDELSKVNGYSSRAVFSDYGFPLTEQQKGIQEQINGDGIDYFSQLIGSDDAAKDLMEHYNLFPDSYEKMEGKESIETAVEIEPPTSNETIESENQNEIASQNDTIQTSSQETTVEKLNNRLNEIQNNKPDKLSEKQIKEIVEEFEQRGM